MLIKCVILSIFTILFAPVHKIQKLTVICNNCHRLTGRVHISIAHMRETAIFMQICWQCRFGLYMVSCYLLWAFFLLKIDNAILLELFTYKRWIITEIKLRFNLFEPGMFHDQCPGVDKWEIIGSHGWAWSKFSFSTDKHVILLDHVVQFKPILLFELK